MVKSKKEIIPIKFSFYPQVDVTAEPKVKLTREETRKLKMLVYRVEDKVEEQLHKKVIKTWYEMLSKIKVEGLKFDKKSGKVFLIRGKK